MTFVRFNITRYIVEILVYFVKLYSVRICPSLYKEIFVYFILECVQ